MLIETNETNFIFLFFFKILVVRCHMCVTHHTRTVIQAKLCIGFMYMNRHAKDKCVILMSNIEFIFKEYVQLIQRKGRLSYIENKKTNKICGVIWSITRCTLCSFKVQGQRLNEKSKQRTQEIGKRGKKGEKYLQVPTGTAATISITHPMYLSRQTMYIIYVQIEYKSKVTHETHFANGCTRHFIVLFYSFCNIFQYIK